MAAALTVQVTLVELVAGLVEVGGEADEGGRLGISARFTVDAASEEALGGPRSGIYSHNYYCSILQEQARRYPNLYTR